MQRLRLCPVGPQDSAFLQYIPGNFRLLLHQKGTVCVGAVFDGQACAAALAQESRHGTYYLRYIFVDPKARLCGLGTYLLRGLLGQIQARGGREVKAVYSPSMLEEGQQTLGILERAGFSPSEPFSTGFSTQLGDIPDVSLSLPRELAVYSTLDAPEAVQDAYQALLDTGNLPDFANAEELESPWGELCSFCTVNGALAGVMLIDRKGEGCHVAGLYVLPGFRGGRTAATLIARSIQAAKALLPPETPVWTSAIDQNAYSMCDKLLRLGNRAEKETELCSVYRF